MDAEKFLIQLGKYGRWQMLSFVLIIIGCNWFIAMQMFGNVFFTAQPNHRCNTESIFRVSTSANQSLAPEEERCYRYVNTSTSSDLSRIPCDTGWNYTSDVYSIASQWDLVCEREYLAALPQSLLLAGVICGSLLSPISDKFGRKPLYLVSCWIAAILAIGSAFSPNVFVFIAITFVKGIACVGCITGGATMTSELFAGDERIVISVLAQFFLGTAHMWLALGAYLVRTWHYLIISLAAPVGITLTYTFLVSESIPWLLSTGKVEKAHRVLKRAAKFNGVTLRFDPLEEFDSSIVDDKKITKSDLTNTTNSSVYTVTANGVNNTKEKKPLSNGHNNNVRQETKTDEAKYQSVFAIFYAPRMRRFTFIMFYISFVANFVYFGIAFGTSNWSGDRYLNYFFNGLSELPAVLVCFFTVPRYGRRLNMIIGFIVGGSMLVAQPFVPVDSAPHLIPLQTTIAMVGKCGIGAAYLNMIYFTTELYPTTHRQLGVGLTFSLGFTAGIIAPFMNIVSRLYFWLPSVIYGVTSFIAFIALLFMPETVNRALPNSIKDVQQWSLQVKREERLEFLKAALDKRKLFYAIKTGEKDATTHDKDYAATNKAFVFENDKDYFTQF